MILCILNELSIASRASRTVTWPRPASLPWSGPLAFPRSWPSASSFGVIFALFVLSVVSKTTLSSAASVKFPTQFPGNRFQVHKIAETGSDTLPHFVLSATGFTEIRDRAKFGVNWTASEPSVIEIRNGPGSVLFFTKFDVNIADQVIAEVVAYVHFFDLKQRIVIAPTDHCRTLLMSSNNQSIKTIHRFSKI